MTDAHRRRFDAVVDWKFDRFARSVSHLLRALETFRSCGPVSSALPFHHTVEIPD
jgi:DNA invertase Pin-like site-specific DNA recombinase